MVDSKVTPNSNIETWFIMLLLSRIAFFKDESWTKL